MTELDLPICLYPPELAPLLMALTGLRGRRRTINYECGEVVRSARSIRAAFAAVPHELDVP